MFDSNLKPWLLEINGNPSLNMEHKIEKGKKVVSPVDLYIKEKVVEGAIEIVMMSKKK